MALELRVWWVFLCTMAVVNVLVWANAARWFELTKARLPADIVRARRLQLWLSAVYVIVCGFRSVLPRADVQRICLVDTFYSSVLVGRILATVAELCFALQWALWLLLLADRTGVRSARRIALLLVPLIVFAEVWSWYAVLTTNFLGNAVEQSTWLTCGALIALAYQRLWPHAPAEARRFIVVTAAVIVCFVAFMSTVDVPLYLSRWAADELTAKVYLNPWVGLQDAGQRWIVEHEWAPWRDESAWMALYFSVGVWVSIALSHAPALVQSNEGDARAPGSLSSEVMG